MKQKIDLSTETIFPVIVAVLSIINLSDNLGNLVSLSGLISLIGITGTFLFFKRHSLATVFTYIWIISQLIIIEPVLNLSQVFSLKFGFNFTTANGDYSLELNIVAVIYLSFFKILQASNIVGKQVTFKEFRSGRFDDIFPLTGLITKRVALADEKNWLLVSLNTSFFHEDAEIKQVLIKRKEDRAIKLIAKDQLIYFRLVINENDLENTQDILQFPFIDWVLCE